jgi:probable phosphoglycerate mutase
MQERIARTGRRFFSGKNITDLRKSRRRKLDDIFGIRQSSRMNQLRNTYYAFRHGESLGTVGYGLTEEGRRQVLQSISNADVFDAETLIFSSDFKRAVETSEIIQSVLGVGHVQFDIRLRERFFGEWEGKSHANYSTAWKKDAYDPEQVFNGAETTSAVRERMWSVVQALEATHSGRNIILVSHGDPLMLLQTAFQEMKPADHRSLPYFSTAECRLLNP